MAIARSSLSDQDLLASLPDSLRALAERGTTRSWRKNTIIIQEGDASDSVFVLLKGSVKAYSMDAEGRELIYGIMVAGDYFGEMSLDGGPRSASVVTEEPCICAVVSRSAVFQHLLENPKFAIEIIAKTISRARTATDTARNIALLDVYGRVARCLESMAERRPDGTLWVGQRLTHQDIASRIGSSREMVSRLIKDLERGGYIEQRERRIILRKKLPARW
jgi:CRP/FNR family cyclic AMP-dependent transcriptional regulator